MNCTIIKAAAAEWTRLVEEIRANYCTDDDEPIPGREDEYHLWSCAYRVRLARDHELDLAKPPHFRRSLAGVTSPENGLPPDPACGRSPLDNAQRNRVRTLGVVIEHLGHILRHELKAACEQSYREAIGILQRIQDKATEAGVEFNLGHAYKNVPAIRDLDAAEAAYQRSLDLHFQRTTPWAIPSASSKSAWCITSASTKPANVKSPWRLCCGTPKPRKQRYLEGAANMSQGRFDRSRADTPSTGLSLRRCRAARPRPRALRAIRTVF